jgi:hypothetical protein
MFALAREYPDGRRSPPKKRAAGFSSATILKSLAYLAGLPCKSDANRQQHIVVDS